MGPWKAVQDFLSILRSAPTGLAADHIGIDLPNQEADLPALVVAISKVKEMTLGLGGLASLEETSTEQSPNQWTETRGNMYSGLLRTEVWGATAEKILELTNIVFSHLEISEVELRRKGFLKFATREVQPIEEVKLGVGDVEALRLEIRFSMIYEELHSSTTDPAGIIKEINVDIRDQFNESMKIHN